MNKCTVFGGMGSIPFDSEMDVECQYCDGEGYTTRCIECGDETETSGETQIGGDGYGGRCCGIADVPCVVWCECGAAYCEDERCPEHDEGKTLLERWNR